MSLLTDSMVAGLRRRPQVPDDLPFLAELMSSAREWERQAFPGDAQTWAALMAHQAAAQDAHYRAHYRDACFEILMDEEGGRPVGRLALAPMADEIRVMDIALVPALRGQGRGTALLQAVMAAAAQAGVAVRLHVEQFNPARRLYARLGFELVEDKGVHLLLEWRPGSAGESAVI